MTSAVTFSLSGPLGKPVIDAGLGPVQFTFIRVVLATALLVAAVALWRPSALRIHRRDIPVTIGFGLFGVAGAQAFFFIAVTRMPVAIATLLEFTAPVFVALWVRIVRRHRLPAAVWVGIAIALAGLAIVAEVWQVSTFDLVGIAAGLASAVSSAGYFLIGQRGATQGNPVAILVGGLVIGLVVMGVIAPPWLLPLHVLDHPAVLATVAFPAWLVITGVAVIATAIPYAVGLASLRHLRASAASVIGLLEPVVAALVAWWLLGQTMQPIQLAGGAFILAGAVLVQLAFRSRGVPSVRRTTRRLTGSGDPAGRPGG